MEEILKPKVKTKGLAIIMEGTTKTTATITATMTRIVKVISTSNLLSTSGAIRVTQGSIVKERR